MSHNNYHIPRTKQNGAPASLPSAEHNQVFYWITLDVYRTDRETGDILDIVYSSFIERALDQEKASQFAAAANKLIRNLLSEFLEKP